MRKIIALATAAAMCLSMTACSVSVSTSETTKAEESAAETTAAEAAESSEAADSDLVATADYPTKPINMIIPYGAGSFYAQNAHVQDRFPSGFSHKIPRSRQIFRIFLRSLITLMAMALSLRRLRFAISR